MNIIDAHCDALWKMQKSYRWSSSDKGISFVNSSEIETNLNRLQSGGVKVQFFAIFVSTSVSSDEMWQHALEQIDLFLTDVIDKNKRIKHIKHFSEINRLKEGEIGAVLTLEGAECFGNDLVKLRMLYELGVLSIGLTWNHANLCGDGALEERGAGLTMWGKSVVAWNNQYNVLTDISHLSEKGMWDVLELADYPIATHSNAYSVCNHPRNLTDEIIVEMIRREAPIHLVFHPPFINKGRMDATMADLFHHIDYICSLGGEKQIGFGSDFDGIEHYITALENASDYTKLIDELLKFYKEEQVADFTSENFYRYIKKYHK